MSFVEWLQDGPLPRERAGGKGASLSELMAAGFRVPASFCISVDAYRAFAASSDATADAPLPQSLAAEIGAAYEALVAIAGEACAVRSSAISEDGAGAAAAGLYESYLNLRGVADVLDAVRRCYASLWSERAVRYRARRGDGADEAMAVVVMSLVPAEASGVAFTAHPVTGAGDAVLINASWGLGEAVVSGLVTPDSFTVRKGDWELIEREIYPKELAIYADAGGGTTERELTPADASAPSISDGIVVEVARVASQIETHYGAPQDVEWAMSGGQIYVLQSRPITTL